MENNEEVLQRIESQLIDLGEKDRRRRIGRVIVWLCVIAALVALAVILVPKLSSFAADYEKSIAILDKLEAALDGVDVQKLSETLKAVSELDAEKLQTITDAIDDVNAILEPIKGLFAK